MESILLDEPPFETKPVNGTLFDISAAARKGKTETVGTIPKNVTKNSEIFDYLRKKSSKRRQRYGQGQREHSYQITDHPNYGTQFVKLSPECPDKDPEADKTVSLDESLKSSSNLPSTASLQDPSRNRLVISHFLTLSANFTIHSIIKPCFVF